MRRIDDIAMHFMSFVECCEDGCWLWRGGVSARGRGVFVHLGVSRLAHRVAWLMRHGTDGPANLRPRCGAVRCVNPEHQEPGKRPTSTLAQRFWGYVAKRDDESCWEWQSGRSPRGYGNFHVERGKASVRAHRFSWELCNGKIPDGLCVLHRCDNPPCVNPGHLFLGTRDDNVKDMMSKGRHVPTSLHGEACSWAKLTAESVRQVRREAAAGVPYAALAQRYGVTPTAVINAVARRSWRHVA